MGEIENEPENRGIDESEKEASFVFFTGSPARRFSGSRRGEEQRADCGVV
jgi:hypothetical protein